MLERLPAFLEEGIKFALTLSDEEALAGQTLLSIETHDGTPMDGFYIYCLQHFPDWLKAIRRLSPEQQEMLLSYYCLGKSQDSIGQLNGDNQSLCSFQVRLATRLAAAYVLMGGPPSAAWMKPILEKAGFENVLKTVPLSQAIEEYESCRSFAQVADRHKLHRPDLRRAMRQASNHLVKGVFASREGVTEVPLAPQESSLGTYLFNLLAYAHPETRGASNPRRKKLSRCVIKKDPDCLGQFRIDVSDPGFGAMFAPQAHR
jgi:hypothetical protein